MLCNLNEGDVAEGRGRVDEEEGAERDEGFGRWGLIILG
jgi:hypothetical protein